MTKPSAPRFAATRFTYAGLFMVALATLMYEVLLTRIFSVTMYYHFAFVAISVAMFGMTAGAMLVYLSPGYFTAARARAQISISTLLFAFSSVLSLLVHLMIPAFSGGKIEGFNSIAPTYILVTVPFIFSGISVCLVLTRYASDVSRLYAADLAGAALGCLGTIGALKITDGPTAVIVVSALAAVGATFFAAEAGRRGLKRLTLACALLLTIAAAGHTALVWKQAPLLRLFWVKGKPETHPLYEKWNSFSRVTVIGSPDAPVPVSGWGLSPAFPSGRTDHELFLQIDSSAGTLLTGYHGDVRDLEHLKYDIVNLAHYLKRDADVLVIGSGGGRDILSALAFQQKSVIGVEINENIIRAVTQRFGDFTGHLERDSRVSFVNDEARSYIARQSRAFDIIQISLIDTWAATAAGAFVLSENSLYTVEAWKTFLRHLSPNGLLTVTRWYFRDRPSEVYRMTSLASAALKQLGSSNPRDHILIARLMKPSPGGERPDGVGTLLVSPTPLSQRDLDAFDEVTRRLGFDVVLSPRKAIDETFAGLASPDGSDQVLGRYPLDISAPTDDRPFFFHMLRFKDVFDSDLRKSWEQGQNRVQLNAVSVLATLLGVVVVLTVSCIGVPLILAGRGAGLKLSWPLLIYFASIGMGFMLVEISQMQRLVVFLGHPTYALSVVLFSLLLSSGAGSYVSRWADGTDFARYSIMGLCGLLIALALFGIVTPKVAGAFDASSTPVRVLLASGILCLLGLFMGMAFPLGMRLATRISGPLTPWLWGVNGAMSVLASVVAVVIALNFGISSSFWTGFAWYVVAAGAFLQARRFVPTA